MKGTRVRDQAVFSIFVGFSVALLVSSGFVFAITWEPSRVFPTFPTPQHLYVFDCSSVSVALWASLTTLQGVVNGKEPRIYLLGWSDDGLTDGDWLTETIVPRGITYEEVAEPWDLFSIFGEEVAGYIVYDPDAIHTINVATTMAGILNATVVHPMYVSNLESLGITMIDDLRGRWKANQTVEMYQWAYDNYWENCSHRILASLDPIHQHLRDYLVATKTFTFFLDPEKTEEADLLRFILSRDEIEISTPVMGWLTEVPGTRILSENGCMLVASCFVSSLTVHTAMDIDLPLEQRPTFANPPVPEDKVYISFIMSDGDNLAYNLYYMLRPLWLDPNRGTIPLGWTTIPLISELAPAVAEWYYSTASDSDYFVAGNGMAYIYPSLYPDLTAFNTKSARYYEAMDLEEMWLINLFDEANTSTAQRIMEEIGLDGIFESLVGPHRATTLLDGRPYLGSPIDIWMCDKTVDERIEDLVGYIEEWSAGKERPYFAFVPALAWCLDPSILSQVAARLSDEYRVVCPDELVALAAVREHGVVDCLVISLVTALMIPCGRRFCRRRQGSIAYS